MRASLARTALYNSRASSVLPHTVTIGLRPINNMSTIESALESGVACLRSEELGLILLAFPSEVCFEFIFIFMVHSGYRVGDLRNRTTREQDCTRQCAVFGRYDNISKFLEVLPSYFSQKSVEGWLDAKIRSFFADHARVPKTVDNGVRALSVAVEDFFEILSPEL